MSPSMTRVLNGLSQHGLRRAGEGWLARCPAHDDGTPSLSIREGDDGRALVYCHGGCATADVVAALGLTMADLSASHPSVGGLAPSTSDARAMSTYSYRDEHGVLLFQVLRYPPKRFLQRRPDGSGTWTWGLGDVRRVLYRLPELLAAPADAPVFIVEGEKDANNVAALGLTATTNPGGAGKWRAEYGEALMGRAVVILPDNDAVGRKHATEVAHALVGIAASTRIVDLPGLPEKGDVSDWLALGGTAEALRELVVSGTAVIEDRPAVGGTQAAPDAWPVPREITADLPPVPAFDAKLLPEAICKWIMDAAERTQSTPEYGAVAALVALGAVIGRGVTIRPKQHDDWTVVPNVWGALVGRPGTLKSPALAEALRHVRRLEAQAHEHYELELELWDVAKDVAEAQRKSIMAKAAKTALRDAEAVQADVRAITRPSRPPERRFVLNDTTVEKLGEVLGDNERGVLIMRDELTGWLAALDREGHEADRAFFLEAWNGTGSFTYDRIGRGTVRIPAASVSLLGGIQPGPFGRYFQRAVAGGAAADGLVQRFQLVVYPDQPSTFRLVDRWPDTPARQAAFALFDQLARPDLADAIGASKQDDGQRYLQFAGPAQDLFNEWYPALMTRARAGTESEAFESHLVKYAKLMPALALIFHLAGSTAGGSVSVVAAEMAAAWCDLLEAHARRVYGLEAATTLDVARTVLARIKAGALGRRFHGRDLYRHHWTGVETAEDAERVLAVIEAHGWVRSIEIPSGARGGRPTAVYEVHPLLARTSKVAA